MTQMTSVLNPRKVVSLVQAAVFLVAAISLISIWKMGSPDQRGETSRDASISFLAIACLIWSLMAILQYPQSGGILTLPSLFRTLLSTVNSAFIVGATAGLEVYENLV